MIPLTPALLVGTASAFIGLGEDGNCRGEGDETTNRGAMVNRLVQRVGTCPDAPWDAASVQHAGYWSHFDHRSGRSSWPIPMRPSTQAIVAFAHHANVLYPEPEGGDLFVLWSPSARQFVHIGIVLHVGQPGQFDNGQAFVECRVLSPNVHCDGRLGGPTTLPLERCLSPERGDAFIRWSELDPAGGGRHSDYLMLHESPDERIDEACDSQDEWREAA